MMKNIGFAICLLIASLPWISAAPESLLSIDELPPKGTTQVWSPLFQASWEKLTELHAGKLAKVEPANAFIAKLEAFSWQADKVMPQDGYAVYAGPATQKFAQDTAAAIKKQFDVSIDPNRVPIIPGGNVAYGILVRDLKFEKKFFLSRNNALEFRSTKNKPQKVKYFGTAGKLSEEYSQYVKVLQYDDEGSSFLLSIATDKDGENLMIYRPSEPCSFGDAFEHVKKAKKAPLTGGFGGVRDPSLHRQDVVKIPYITLKADTDFTAQLKGNIFYAGEATPWRIVKAFQVTQFELFEDGAKVRVETAVGGEPFGEAPKPRAVPVVPRNFICDRPFFVFLWRADAEMPYLAAWIDGGDCLTEFKK